MLREMIRQQEAELGAVAAFDTALPLLAAWQAVTRKLRGLPL